jgi:hypothetical protein
MIEAIAADPTKRIARARAQYDRAHAALITAIREDVAAGIISVTEAARQAGWSRYYIGQIRDGAAGDSPPRHRRRAGRPAPVLDAL